MVLDRYTTPLSPLSHSILMEWCVYKHQEWYPLNSERIMHFSWCCEALKLWVMFASFQQYATPSEKHFWVCGSYKLEFRTCLNSQSVWRLVLDSVEQSQSSCVIIGLGQEMYAEKPITYIPLQVSISYIGIKAFIDCSQCHRYIRLIHNTFYASVICYEFLCTSFGLQWQVLILSISCLEINIYCLYYMY